MRLLELPEPITVRAQLASQARFAGLRVGIHRVLADDQGGYAVLLIRDDATAARRQLRPGEHVDLPGHGRLTLADVQPSTRERRGWVELVLQP